MVLGREKMSLPKTTLGLITMMVFMGFLFSLIYSNEYKNPYMDTVTDSEQAIVNASNGINGSQGTYESITSVFAIGYNLIVMILGLIAGIFVSLSIFLSTMTLLPVWISQVVIALTSIGIMFSIISKVVNT